MYWKIYWSLFLSNSRGSMLPCRDDTIDYMSLEHTRWYKVNKRSIPRGKFNSYFNAMGGGWPSSRLRQLNNQEKLNKTKIYQHTNIDCK